MSQPSSVTVASPSFAQLVSLACHDLRTPLATASGFTRTLERLDTLEQPADRYVEMIGAAADQLASLLDLLAVAARIESDRFEPQFREANARELADEAAARLGDGIAAVSGDGRVVRAEANWSALAIAALAEAARRHGGLEEITLTVDGASIAIAVGNELKDFAAAVGTRVLTAAGAEVEPVDDRVEVRFPAT
jgi:signal transduction histidine kinase